jgi:hypothetical protein
MQGLTESSSIQNTQLASEAGTVTSVIQYYRHPLVITRRAIKFYPKQMLTLAGSQICTVSSQNIDFPPLFTPTTYTERLFSAATSGKIKTV